MKTIKIERALIAQKSEAELLLHEYYDAIGVQRRDTPEQIAAFLSDASSAFWIAYVEQAAAGCVALRPFPLIARAAECKRLYVRPGFRKLGVAGALLDAMEETATVRGSEWIYLDSKDDLADALRLYARRGYEACERFNDNPQATVFLRKDLRGAKAGLKRSCRSPSAINVFDGDKGQEA